MTKKQRPVVFCLLCNEGCGNNVHLGRHVLHAHAMRFADYDWHHVQKNTEPPRCADCQGQPAEHSGHYLRFCSQACSAAGHTLSDEGKQRVARAARLIGLANCTHGESNPPTPEYRTYFAMLSRCLNSDHRAYPDYGGRGIKVCDHWRGEHGFLHFLEDMGRRPSSDLSLDRIDNDGDYEPGNCRWATRAQQQRNKRKSIARFEGQAAPREGT